MFYVMATGKLLTGPIIIRRGCYGSYTRCCSTYSNNSLSKIRKSEGERLSNVEELNEKKTWPLLLHMKKAKVKGPEAALQTSLVPAQGVDFGDFWADVAIFVALVGKFSRRIKPNHADVQMLVEKGIIDCRFFTLLAVAGSLLGSVLCFVEGCFLILKSYLQYFHALSQRVDPGCVADQLIESIDMFLVGTAMLIFGMGLYVMFVGPQSIEESQAQVPPSNFFGLFSLKMVPSWLKMQSLSQAKSRVGHAMMMILQVGVLEKFKSIPLVTPLDLTCFAGALLVSSACIFVLSKVPFSKQK